MSVLEKSGDRRRAGPQFSFPPLCVRPSVLLLVSPSSRKGAVRFYFYYYGGAGGDGGEVAVFGVFFRDASRGQCQAGSLSGAEHLSKDNAGVPRPAQRGQKPRVEQKGKCWLDPDFQYEYGP